MKIYSHLFAADGVEPSPSGLGSQNEPQDEVIILSAFSSPMALHKFIKSLTKNCKKSASINIYLDFGAARLTNPAIFKDYSDCAKCLHARKTGSNLHFIEVDRIFHPKAYCFRKGRKWEVLVGSPNLSSSGFSTQGNEEIVIKLSTGDATAFATWLTSCYLPNMLAESEQRSLSNIVAPKISKLAYWMAGTLVVKDRPARLFSLPLRLPDKKLTLTSVKGTDMDGDIRNSLDVRKPLGRIDKRALVEINAPSGWTNYVLNTSVGHWCPPELVQKLEKLSEGAEGRVASQIEFLIDFLKKRREEAIDKISYSLDAIEKKVMDGRWSGKSDLQRGLDQHLDRLVEKLSDRKSSKSLYFWAMPDLRDDELTKQDFEESLRGEAEFFAESNRNKAAVEYSKFLERQTTIAVAQSQAGGSKVKCRIWTFTPHL